MRAGERMFCASRSLEMVVANGRSLGLTVVILVSASVCLPGTAAAAPRPQRCGVPRHGRVVARSADALVIDKRQNFGDVWSACWRHTGRRTRLLSGYFGYLDAEYAHSFRLAGRYVAFARERYDHYFRAQSSYEVFDVRAGRRRYEERNVGGCDGEGCPVNYPFDLVLTTDGWIGWEQRFEYGPARSVTVLAHDSRGTRALDRGGPHDFSPLALNGEVLSWKKDGIPKSATLS